MKKLIAICFIALSFLGFSQSYRTGFDEVYQAGADGLSKGQGRTQADNVKSSYATNVLGTLSDPHVEVLESYINMFYATRDKKYLDAFIINAARIQWRRDDNITSLPLTNVGFPQYMDQHCTVQDFGQVNTNSKGWNYMIPKDDEDNTYIDCVWDKVHFMHAARICYPLAVYCYLIITEEAGNNSLIHTQLPDEAKLLPPSTCSNTGINTYYDFAVWLKCRLLETYNYIEDKHFIINPKNNQQIVNGCYVLQNNSVEKKGNSGNSYKVKKGGPGAYTENEKDGLNSSISALNMQTTMGKFAIYMYKLYNFPSMLCRVYYIAGILRGQLNHIQASGFTEPNRNLGTYKWSHVYDYDPNYYNDEDIIHGEWSMHFAALCHQFNLKDPLGNELFNDTHMKIFGNTIAYQIYDEPGKYFMGVDGSNIDCEQYCITSNGEQKNDPNKLRHDVGGYLAYFSQYNPYIKNITSEYYDNRAVNHQPYAITLPYTYLAIAQSPYFKWNNQWNSNYKFNPVALRNENVSSDIRGAAVGDFDNDGINEIVTYNAISEKYVISNIGQNSSSNNSINTEMISQGFNTSFWTNIAAGDIDPFHPGDEFVSVNKANSKIYLFSRTGNTLINVNQFVFSQFPWRQVIVSDIDLSHQGDEILILNSNGEIYLLVYDYQTQSFGVFNKGSISVSNAVAMAVGNFDPNNPNVQFATVENGSGYIKIFEYNITTNTLNTTPLYTYTASGTGNQWRTMTAGDFDEDGIDELLAYRHYDGQVMMFKVKNGSLPLVYSEYFPPDQEIAVLASGKFNQFLGGDAFVVLRNYDGKLTVFTMEGQCPGVKLQNTLVDANYTPDNIFSGTQNNYVVDYHANNTLMASNNFVITAPSQVEFTAGKRIVLKPGFKAVNGSKFHAYIDNQLACNTPYLRTGNTSPTQNNEPESQQQLIEAFNFKVFPNPNTGNFTVYLEESTQAQTLTILNMLGEQVSQINTLEKKLEINLSSYPKGVYFVNVQSSKGASAKKVVVN